MTEKSFIASSDCQFCLAMAVLKWQEIVGVMGVVVSGKS